MQSKPRVKLLILFSLFFFLFGTVPFEAARAAQKKPSSKPAAKARKSTGKTVRRSRGRRIVRGPSGPTAARIKEVQEALAKGGFYRTQPNGKLDSATTSALSAFQRANGLQATGKLNVWTLRALEKHGLPRATYASVAKPFSAEETSSNRPAERDTPTP